MPKELLVAESGIKKKGTRWNAKLIEGNKRGSSAFYPADVLERDGARAFPAGTKIFFDHPGLEEQWDRPERSVRDLVGVTEADARYEGDGLYAPVSIFSNYSDLVQEIAEHTGMSIRASGIVEEEEMNGEFVPVLKALTSGQSVDIVTEAGAGGKLVGLLESARSTQPPKPAPPKSPKEENSMDVKELAEKMETQHTALLAAISGLTESLTEALKPAPAPKVEKPSYGDIDKAVTEAKLPALMRTRVFDLVESGKPVDEAVSAAKELVEAIRKDTEAQVVEGAAQDEGNLKETDTIGKLVFG